MGCYLKPLPIEQSQISSHSNPTQSDASLAIWVQLAVLPNPYSHNQALLLYRHADDEWMAWIPDHGEAVLHRSEFYFDADWN